MKKTTNTLALLFAGFTAAYAQNVGIGTSAPNASAKLEITSTNSGVLIPRVALTTTTAAGPVTSPATSLLVYNTATISDVTPGYYYWDGTKWVRLNDKTGWTILGNTGTNAPAAPVTYGTSTIAATENWLGTTDAQDFVIGTNNIERFRVKQATGRVGIGIAAPTTTLEVSSGTADAVFGHSNSVGGYLGRETNITFGTPAQTLLGSGVYANNPASGYTSSFAQSSGAADVAANISFSSVWIPSYNYAQNGSATVNPSAVYAQVNVTNATLGGFQTAIRGFSDRGTTAGNPGYTVGGNFTANSQNQDAIGVYGNAFSNTTYSVGGYFAGNNYAGTSYAYAWVGGAVGGINRKITGTGTVAEIIPTPNHGRITLICPESPEYWYQDYGSVELVNGRAHVDLDPILADIIFVDAQNPIRAFFTPQDMLHFNGAAIVNQSTTGFDIVELNGGTHSGKIQYQIIVKPKTNYGEGRFPQAPGPAYLKPEMEPLAAKAKNQPSEREIFQWPADHEVYGYDPASFVPVGELVPAGEHAGKFKFGDGTFRNYLPANSSELKTPQK